MKSFFIVLIICLLGGIFFSQCGILGSGSYGKGSQDVKAFPDAKIVSVTYQKKGTMAVPDLVCELWANPDGSYTAKYGRYGEDRSVGCGKDVAERVMKCLREGKLHKYKEHYYTRMRIHDGHSWSIKAKFDNNTTISSGGYMAYPKDFSAVTGFCSIIEGLFKN